MKQIPLPIGTTAARTFENFATGANHATLAHLRSLRPGATPVYLWGPSGCGKTHLAQAVIQHLQLDGIRCLSFGAQVPAPWSAPDTCGLVVLDDCECLMPDQQQSAFSLFVQSAQGGASILAAGRLPPVDLPLREDLRTRLGWGHILAVHALSEHETRAELRREADRRGIGLTEDVIEYLLRRFTRDLKSLLDLLDRLDEYSLAAQRHVTVPLLKEMLAQRGPNQAAPVVAEGEWNHPPERQLKRDDA